MSWYVTANEIDKWMASHTREAQELLPELVKRLILATIDLESIYIPIGVK